MKPCIAPRRIMVLKNDALKLIFFLHTNVTVSFIAHSILQLSLFSTCITYENLEP